MQNTAEVLMIRPVNFGFNPETAINNAFQVPGDDEKAQEKAREEFDQFLTLLRGCGVHVLVAEDSPEPYTPDSIFPNNWISFHQHNIICLYPMFAPNRRGERKPGVIQMIRDHFKIDQIIDFSSYEDENLFLEGTGSMVLDRDQKIAYACLSPRTDQKLLEEFCSRMGYRAVTFTALDGNHLPIYHTNVMMCVADHYVVICLDAVRNPAEKEAITTTIQSTGKTMITITMDQMNHFAGNMLQLRNEDGKPLLVMSSQAYRSLRPDQVKTLEAFNAIIHSSLDTIEANGGGSARCMIAEIFLDPR